MAKSGAKKAAKKAKGRKAPDPPVDQSTVYEITETLDSRAENVTEVKERKRNIPTNKSTTYEISPSTICLQKKIL